jgi:hypothetical protein
MDLNELNKITVVELTAICRCHIALSRLDCRTRASLYAAVQEQNPLVRDAINVDVEKAIQSGFVKYKKGRERREMGESERRSKRPRLHEEEREPIELNGALFFFFLCDMGGV